MDIEPKEREIKIDCINYEEFECFADEMIIKIQKMKGKYEANGYYNIRFSWDSGHEGGCLNVFGTRLETKREAEARTRSEKNYADRMKVIEERNREEKRQEYLRLKKEFEPESL